MNPMIPHARTTSRRGFTLVEIMLVVVIIGMLAMLALPMLTKHRDNARAARLINDLRNAVHAFETYALMTGYYPETSGVGIKPDDMEDELRRPQWEKPTPIGGGWKWSAPGGGDYYAAVLIVEPTASASVLRSIDKRIDDGNLNDGNFVYDGCQVIYVVE